VRDRNTGLLFVGAPSVPEIVALARRAEAAGFDSLWMAETRMTRDAFVPMAAMAAATERIRIGSGIVNVYTRGAVVLAISFIGLEELAPGRILMGLGTGSPLVLAPQGVAFEKPLTRLRDYCEVIPRLIRGEEVSYAGETIRLEGARVEDLLSAQSEIGGPRTKLPLWLGVTGPRALEYAGEVADGVLLNTCLPTDYVRRALTLIERGARKAGRSLDEIDIAMANATAPHSSSAEGKRVAARFIALYLSFFPNIARETGVDEAKLAATRRAFEERGLEAAGELIGDDVVDQLTIAGTVDECRERLDEYRAAGVRLPVLAPLEGTIGLAVDELAKDGSSAAQQSPTGAPGP
jgi:5,10-methylenetetrahydromethanopterin reductase